MFQYVTFQNKNQIDTNFPCEKMQHFKLDINEIVYIFSFLKQHIYSVAH